MHTRSLAALLFLAIATIAAAQAPTPAPAPPQPAPMNIPKTAAAIDLDGALDDAAWQNAAVIDQFYETSPGDNVPAKVRTVAYITYDARYFYIGIRADDPEPRKIRAPFVDRDGVIGTDDNIAVFLDTRNDKRSAIELRVNPRGIQADGIFNDANFNEDFAPDFYYDTAAQITKEGWTAEFRIPFDSLRYSSADPQTWNILVWRNWPRDFRYAFHSAPMPRGSNCIICFTHPLTGLTGLPEASHFVAAPYVTAQQVSSPEGALGSGLENGDFETDAGIDVKWNPSANHAVDLTLNPDFSQIEADVPQILVNQRFAVFFPEKRPFFLEGFDLFDTPMQVAYTRTITSPRAGARATGKIGSTAYTFLTTQDRGGGLTIIPGPTRSGFAPLDMKSYATIARVRHDLGNSFVGGVLTDREIDGGGHNRVIGPDFQWRMSQHTFTGQFLYSDTENPNRPDLSGAWNGESSSSHAFNAAWDHRTRTYDGGVEYSDIGDGFRADLGFLPQVGYRELVGYYGRSYYPENRKVRFFRPSIVVAAQADRDNDRIYDLVSLGINGFGAKNTQFSALARSEGILVGNELLKQNYLQLFYQWDPYRRIPRITLQARVGDQIDFDNGREGEGLSLSISANVRPHDRLDLQFFMARDTVDVDGGRLFTAMVERVRGQYSFSAKSLVRVIAQYVTTDYNPALYNFPVPEQDGSFLGSVLYSYKLNWQTVLFAGYGDDRLLLEDDRLVRTGRSLFFKVSYAFIR
ncbi:MAG TPA: DUF5916 domain-containing protein [Thermoanaerobaculia bacterium]|jgi:hypothetical protein|nr:DUF5916 domain-containing protein [Thermoanaerobaculia bacterium]